MHSLSRRVQDAIDALQRCHVVCLSMATVHCPEMGGEHARPQHILLMLDCAARCTFTADALARNSQFHNRFAGLCAEVCRTCAEDCENIGDMEECATICRSCIQICTDISRSEHAEIIGMAESLPPSAS